MKKMYKIFGAIAIIGLFLLSSIASTSGRLAMSTPAVEKEDCILMTDEQEAEFGVSTEPGAEPAQAFFFPDLIPWSVNVEISLTKKTMVLGIKNDGRSMLYYNFNSHAEIQKIGENIHKDYTCRGFLWLRGQMRYFRVKIPWAIYLNHDVKINVDDKEQIFEGLGEINNNEKFDDVYFGPLP